MSPVAVGARLAAHAGLRCTFRRCPNPPVRRMTPSNSPAHWWGCRQHHPSMLAALHIGLPGATTGTGWVDVIEIDTEEECG
jgi:hypothetical protein